MLIREWMTKDVITVTLETSMLKASKLMKDHDIRRLPVVDGKSHVIGIVSDRDIKAASPSKATTLDTHELYYLLSELKIKDIMTADPVIIRDTDTVETAALILEEKNFGGLPVVNEAGEIVGIITDHDIFKLLVDISGARSGGLQLALRLPDEPGALCPIFDTLSRHNANIFTILTSRSNVAGGMSHVYIRLHPMEKEKEKELIGAVRNRLSLEYWVDDTLHEMESGATQCAAPTCKS